MTDAAKAVWRSWRIGLAGQVSTNIATDMASGTNSVGLGHRPKETGIGLGGSKAELVEAEEEAATGMAEDIIMTKIATMTMTETGIDTEMGDLATND